MKLLGSKIITTERLILRPTEKQDLRILYDILMIPEVNKYYLTSKIGLSWKEEEPWQLKKLARAKDNDVFQWSIVKKEDNSCIGQLSIQEKGNHPIEIRDIGWFIDPKEQRKGYGVEAAEAGIKYMFDHVGITSIETSSAIVNEASWKLMEKLGFRRRENAEYMNDNYTFLDEPVKCYRYGLTKEEYTKRK